MLRLPDLPRRNSSDPDLLTSDGRAQLACADVCRAILDAGDPLSFRIGGASMVPSLWPGETIVVETRRIAEVAIGEIVVFRRANAFVVHRVVALSGAAAEQHVVTRGDAVACDDGPIGPGDLLGVAVAVHRSGRRRALHSRGIAAMALGHLVRRSAFARRVVTGIGVRLVCKRPETHSATAST